MVNRPKRQGTAYETHTIKRHQHHGLKAYRIAEGGPTDAGDLALELPDGTWLVAECKARAALNPHTALAKADTKTLQADLPFLPLGTVLFHKRLTRKDGQTRRTPDGVREIVSMTPELFYMLIEERMNGGRR